MLPYSLFYPHPLAQSLELLLQLKKIQMHGSHIQPKPIEEAWKRQCGNTEVIKTTLKAQHFTHWTALESMSTKERADFIHSFISICCI